MKSVVEKKKFRSLAGRYFNWLYRNYPVAATSLGVHRYDDQLASFDREAIKARLKKTKRFLLEFKKIKASSLELSSAIDLQVLKNEVRWEILAEEEVGYWQKAPSIYSDEIIWGLYFLINRRFAPRPVRARSLLARLQTAPFVLKQGKRNLNKPCLVWVEIAIDSIKGGIAFLKTQVAGFARETKNQSLKKEIMLANRELIKAFENYLRFLAMTKKKARKEFALGKSLFEKKLKLVQAVDWSADELLKIGWDVFGQTEKEMAGLARSLFSEGSWWEAVQKLKKSHPTRQGLLSAYQQEMKKIKRFLTKEKIVPLPKNERLKLMSTPESERATVPYAAYLSPAPFEKDQTGQFWVTPVDVKKSQSEQGRQLEEHALFHLSMTVLHESYPGHHLQLVFANQRSSFVRKHLHNTPYVEGWALYCEQLMVETGYLARPEQRLFQLKDQLWRAARIILDVSLHTNQMTFKQAVDFLIDRVHLEKSSALSEVRRYTLEPTYQLSYLIGKLQILALRAKARETLGDKFTLNKFHRLFLKTGPIPIGLVEKEILRSVGKGPSFTKDGP